MEATTLWRFLQGLCHDFHWDYAVFWKLQPDQMLLKWEEGYCHHSTLTGSMESELVDMRLDVREPMFSFTWGSSRQDGCSHEFPVGISLDDMASVQYHLGEGVVGKVACTGNHSWILSEDLLVCDFDSNVVPEFATGSKTIVLIPVVRHGVLQLGSSKKVGEDPAMVALVRDKFDTYFNNMDVVPTLSVEFQPKLSSSHISKLNLDELSSSMICQMKPEDPEAVHCVKQASNDTTTNQMMPLDLGEDACYSYRENVVENGNSMRGNDISRQLVGSDGMFPINHDIVSEMLDITMNGSSTVEEDVNPLSYSNYNFGIFGEDIKVEDKLVEPFVDETTDSMTNISSLFCFPVNCELHKEFGPTFQRTSKEHLWDAAVASEDSQSCSSELSNRNLLKGNETFSWKPSECHLNRNDEEHLLEAVYAAMENCLNDDLSEEPNDAKSSVESLGQLSASTNKCISGKKMGVSRSSVTINGPNAVVTQSPPPFSTENILSTLINEQKLKKGYKDPQTKKGLKAYKRRVGTNKSTRPRPRDRQLIQDRVKELRELVPNGSKCSIDGLLDRTIKHMLFLRGVSERAGKLRHWVNQEVSGQKKMRLSSPKPDSNNGTSWAFEIGSDFQVCPIVVKDLERPGHMLIEMLCNDNGLFLEIAEVIHRLDLTILKGVMESHASNTWAHFIVEVSQGFQRLDIFWPLMQLLQKNRTPVLD